jgi:predicted DNA-binding transcriptional regulator AlpA
MPDEPAILLSDNSAAALLGISRATFWRRVQDGTFPQPIRIAGLTRWRRDELMAAIDAVSAQRAVSPSSPMAVPSAPRQQAPAISISQC